ncbi:histone H2B.3-like [Cucumis melo var. makuwa]|uniref:Histone H2B.3-like n=1 Tax=Cucumis melo var. makuwa TaxID=1194695 RepID=A0A5D3BP76_CUCMM|nr:histone H2B.3-like [Cucumis melo var. makuwa]
MSPRRGSQPYRICHSGRSRRDGAAIPGHATFCFGTFSCYPAGPDHPCSDPGCPAQTQATPAQAPVVPYIESDQPSTKAKHLRNFRKYNPKTFDGSMDNPTKAQMWLTSIEKIFRYMKCPND